MNSWRESYSHILFLPQNYMSLAAILEGVDRKFKSEPLRELKKSEKNEPKLRNSISKFWVVGKEGKNVVCKGEGRVKE